MNPTIARLIKRLLVLLLGAGLAYITVWQVFPFFDRRTEDGLALIATYVAMAYIILPAGIRAIRVFYQPKHIPLYCVTPDGFASDPINIGLIGTKTQVIEAMTKAGWNLADQRTLFSLSKVAWAIIVGRPYPNAPFSTLYLFGRRQDLGFERGVDGHPFHRHHIRLWACNLHGPEEFHQDVHFWRRLHQPYLPTQHHQLWVGAASKDIGLAPIRHTAQITHLVAADTNEERELIVRNLEATNLVASVNVINVSREYSLRNRALRASLSTDGKLAICELKA